MVAFHAQQAIENSLKAIIDEFDLGFVKTHQIERLSLHASGIQI